ncbi:hypothetical protein G6F46_004969 [Rhizopus delemar]|nr:hypothetical protein G6F52_007124 [Rhizopus delemar]KAG1602779.1 hypothetical protein G6F47_002446 [Rhizopus delemar]KAG1617045.1 hypothetical protein G6F46_004969 [Rhizopus delemar]KAG1631766.1 hypothetical protein G6F45_004586 [Rhizopus arrhizus]
MSNTELNEPSRSRGDQPPKDSTKYTEALHEKYPSIPVKLTCPCCCDLFVNKSALKTHVDEQHNVFQQNLETRTSDWNIHGAYRSDEIDGLKTRCDLISLAEKSTDPERNVVLAVESLIPAMIDVDLCTISENHLAASYVHPVMQSLFSTACNNKVSHCSNTLPEVDDATGKRPDYIVDVYERYQYAYSSCFGEIKIEKANDTLKVLDFYRLAIFGRNAIESHNLNGIICFQTIGSLVTFYYMLPRADFFIFLEVTSIKIPLVKRDIVSIITHLDDMLSLVCLYELIEIPMN